MQNPLAPPRRRSRDRISAADSTPTSAGRRLIKNKPSRSRLRPERNRQPITGGTALCRRAATTAKPIKSVDDDSSASSNPPVPHRGRTLGRSISEGSRFFFAKLIISRSSKRSFREEFKIPDGQRDHRRRHPYRRPTRQRGSLNGRFRSEDLVIMDVSVEILISWIGRNSLVAKLNHRE
jgi:hypothetical protein